MSRRRNPAGRWLLTSVTILFGRVVSALPLEAARLLGRSLAAFAYYAVPRVRKVGLANLDLAYGDTLTAAEKRAILKQAVRNVGIVAAEFPRIGQLRGRFLDQHVTFKGLDRMPAEGGFIIIAAHHGNWEWMAPAMAGAGRLVAEVVRPLDDPRLDAFIDRIRRSGDVETLSKDEAGVAILRLLKQGYIAGVLVDQSPRDNAAPARFFGQPCWATVGAAVLAIRARVPVLPVSMTRGSDGRYVLEFEPELDLVRTGRPSANIAENAQRCQDAIEAIVRRAPGQWLWLHRRWKARDRLEREWAKRTRKAE
ncbi:MAG: hypothetical protein GWP08_04995 [Nitrospiraceae bacterium]|nr:hypothetical protein [Nitrospiraceae bacterium]